MLIAAERSLGTSQTKTRTGGDWSVNSKKIKINKIPFFSDVLSLIWSLERILTITHRSWSPVHLRAFFSFKNWEILWLDLTPTGENGPDRLGYTAVTWQRQIHFSCRSSVRFMPAYEMKSRFFLHVRPMITRVWHSAAGRLLLFKDWFCEVQLKEEKVMWSKIWRLEDSHETQLRKKSRWQTTVWYVNFHTYISLQLFWQSILREMSVHVCWEIIVSAGTDRIINLPGQGGWGSTLQSLIRRGSTPRYTILTDGVPLSDTFLAPKKSLLAIFMLCMKVNDPAIKCVCAKSFN